MKKLIGQDVAGHVYVVECDEAIFLQTKLIFGKGGIDLYSYDDAIKEEAKRITTSPDSLPRYRFTKGNVTHYIAHKVDNTSKVDPILGENISG